MISFCFNLIGHGWIEAALLTEDGETKIMASYLSNAPNDLIIALALLVEGQNIVVCSWQDEPGEYRWVFERQNDSFQLRIYKLKETFS